MPEQWTHRVAAVVLSLMALLCCALLLVGGHSGGLLSQTPMTFTAGVVLLLEARLLKVAARLDPEKREGWEAVFWAATSLGAGLVAQALLQGAWPRAADGTLVGCAFALGAAGAAAFLYQGLIHWNRFQTTVSDASDRLNGLSAVAVFTAAGVFVVHLLDPPMARWPGLQVDLWLVHVGTLVVLLGTVASVAELGGMWRDRRVWMLLGVLAAAVSVSIAAGFRGDPQLTLATLQAVWVAVLSVVAGSRVMGPARFDARAATPEAPAVGALVVLGAGLVVLALDGAVIAHAPVSVTLFATAGCLGSASRLTHLVRQLAELAQSRQEARTDHLTGIANRRGFSAALAESVSGVQRHALLVVDLDRFKEVNDRYGHAVGDEVLTTVARRLQSHLGDRDLLGRLGGDEFAVLLHATDELAAAAAAHRLWRAAGETVTVGGRPLRLGASIGVATTDLGGRREGELMRRADAAMYVAKRAGGGVSVYDGQADRRAQEERELLEDLRLVLGEDASELQQRQIVAHYQPQVDLRSGAVIGVEALVRWQHPQRGLLFPDAFLEMVERDGLMGALTARVLRQAVTEAVRWQSAGHRLRVSVNLSTSCLSDPDLVPRVDEVCAVSGLDPALLTLEITETTLMADPEHAMAVVHQIASRGIGISIDDYGTGYSSLAYLTDLPARELKLDRAFTARLLKEPRTASVVAGTITLAHHLGMQLVAEGVENDATAALLVGLGCDTAQGYLHARPMTAGALVPWLREADLRQSGRRSA